MIDPVNRKYNVRFLNLTKFALLYDMHRDAVSSMLKRGVIKGTRIGNQWRILDPGYEWMQMLKDPIVLRDIIPLFRVIDVAQILQRSRLTVETHIKRKRLKGTVYGHVWRCSIADLRAFMLQKNKRTGKRRGAYENIPDMKLVVWAQGRLQEMGLVALEPVPFFEGPPKTLQTSPQPSPLCSAPGSQQE